MEIIATYGFIFMAMAVVFGLYMTWGIGANDVANAMGTSVGSGAITVKQAIIIAAIFEFAGAFIAGGNVTKTIERMSNIKRLLTVSLSHSAAQSWMHSNETPSLID